MSAPLPWGTREVGVAFVKKPAVAEGVLQPPVNMSAFGYSTDEEIDGDRHDARHHRRIFRALLPSIRRGLRPRDGGRAPSRRDGA